MNDLKFGVAIPYGSAREAAGLGKLAENAGWDGIFLGDAIWCEDPLISLAAVAMLTDRIRLGSMIIPAPLRRPWEIASQALALDRLSGGRLSLGLGAGAVWMGWQGFPGEVQDAKTRAEMLDETIDVLDILFSRRQQDYPGKHFPLKLTDLDPQHYPPAPVQQPRIPLWVPGLWPREKSMARVLKADGILMEKLNPDNTPAEVSPADVSAVRDYVAARRVLTTPFDIVVSGQVLALDPAARLEQMAGWRAAGATWWVEAMWGLDAQQAGERIRQGPPRA
jgi:alkanesulfonate monooxygenase SsuD/methylene tetrahydromethanopterin reductase-like flavin-dependent oxidoreductase (luciferase family)